MNKKNITVITFIVFITFIYLLTLPQSIGLGDSGTLAAAAKNFGIPHPPGFPGYLLIAHWFQYLPVGTMAQKFALVSVFASLGTIFLVFRMAGILPGLILAFSYGFWSQAVNVEAYALTNFVIVLIGYLIGEIGGDKGDKGDMGATGLMAIGGILGLGLGLNPIVVAVFPGIIYKIQDLRFMNHESCFINQFPKNVLLLIIPAGVIAAAVYGYLPLRAAANPVPNWGDPSTLEQFFKHVTGGGLNIVSQTAVNGFTGSVFWMMDALKRFLGLWAIEFLGLGTVLMIIGGTLLFRRERQKFIYWSILILTNVLLAGLYTSGNRDSWFITSFIGGAVLIGGVRGVRGVRGRRGIRVAMAAAVILELVVWGPGFWKNARSNFTGNYIADLYRDLPENSILLGGGETFNSLTLYASQVIQTRPDVTPVDFTIYYGQKWYRQNLGDKGGKGDWGDKGVEMAKFTDEMEFSRILEQFVRANQDRSVFVTGYLLTQPVYGGTLNPAYIPQEYGVERKGIVYRVEKLKNGQTDEQINGQIDNPVYLESNYQKSIDLIKMEYGLALEKQGDYFLSLGESGKAFELYRKAAETAPSYFDLNRLGSKVKAASDRSPSPAPKDK